LSGLEPDKSIKPDSKVRVSRPIAPRLRRLSLTLWVNRHMTIDPNMPFGGALRSDFGEYWLDTYGEVKSICNQLLTPKNLELTHDQRS